ncbi:spondin domain-containing protein [Tautonia plasticadhaerens]|uniref:Spondin_N n=1 Tax=Tautonia plasticadhaerens TaxID=2527974 RepID=A0A518H0G9_9BACT|nr:spondin domain-containing protein [Tautonia plasticadhaerens]QDV34329.1 Spondin_N [Tautonia plasticadhaerens]
MIANRIASPGMGIGVLALVLGMAAGGPALGSSTTLRLTVENLSPTGGVHLTPVWFGFHDGDFDLYDRGAPASEALERIAEDGNPGPLDDLFDATANGSLQGVLFGDGAGPGFPGAPVIAPGGSASIEFSIDSMSGASRFFSYASMIVPSNDFFIANGDPMAFELFDDLGNFLGNTGTPGVFEFLVLGSQVLDAGTEVNDELMANTAFFGQATPDTGVDEDGTVELAGGFLDGGPILGDPRFADAQFAGPGYQVARFRLAVVPEPSSVALCGLGAAGIVALASRSRRRGMRSIGREGRGS